MRRIAKIILVALIVTIVVTLLFGCGGSGNTATSVNTKASHTSLYELYVLDDSPNNLILYNNYKVKDNDVHVYDGYGSFRTIYHTTNGTEIIISNNGVIVVSPQGYVENFTQGYMRRIEGAI